MQTMYGCNLSLPVIIRAPYGAGRGYGPTHSQTPIELFSNLQNTAVLTPSLFSNFDQIFDNVLSSGNPAIMMEAKLDYGKTLGTLTAKTTNISMMSLFNGFDFDHMFYFKNSLPKQLHLPRKYCFYVFRDTTRNVC